MKKLVLAVFCLAVLGGFGFSQNLSPADLGKLEDAERQMKDYMSSFLKILPDVATQQNVQPKAWIGYLYQDPFPQITKKSGRTVKELPHFTLGWNLAAGLASTDTLNKIGDTLGQGEVIPIPVLPFPSFSVDARIGGIKTGGVDLPFDLGFSFFTLNLDLGSMLGGDADLGLKWTNWGVDARYLVLRQNRAIPDVSVGAGFAQWLLDLDAADVIKTELSTNTAYASAQASYTLNFFIPYLGLKVLGGTNKGNVKLTLDESLVPSQAQGHIPEDQKSRTLKAEEGFFQMQLFGGFGFDWLVFQTSIGASIDVFTGVPGFNFTTRLSL